MPQDRLNQGEPMPEAASGGLLGEFVAVAAIVGIAGFVQFADALTAGRIGLLGQAIVVGSTAALMLAATTPRTPGLAHPGVVLGLFTIGRLSIGRAAGLWMIQGIGAVMGALLARAVFPGRVLVHAHFALAQPHPELSPWHVLLVDGLVGWLTIWLLFGLHDWFRTGHAAGQFRWHPARRIGIIMGIMLAIIWIGLIPVTGSVGNPVFRFGFAMLANDWHGLLGVWLAPLVGAWGAAVLFNVRYRPPQL